MRTTLRAAQSTRRWIASALLALAPMAAEAAAPEVEVTIAGRAQKYTAEVLLANPAAVTVTVSQDVAYKRAMTYRAVPTSVLFAGLPRDESIRFATADGFSAIIGAGPLLAAGDDAPRAYLAIEPPAAPWPPLRAGGRDSAGPFYLVWLRPEKGRISTEQRPYQIVAMESVPPVAVRFPALVPAATVQGSDPIRHGFTIFATNCLPCHTLNLSGDSRKGPDLNVPFSPTEYLREDFLRLLIRNPQSLRAWPQSAMPGFDQNALSNRDLDDLLAYLYYMAKRKVAVPKG